MNDVYFDLRAHRGANVPWITDSGDEWWHHGRILRSAVTQVGAMEIDNSSKECFFGLGVGDGLCV